MTTREKIADCGCSIQDAIDFILIDDARARLLDHICDHDLGEMVRENLAKLDSAIVILRGIESSLKAVNGGCEDG